MEQQKPHIDKLYFKAFRAIDDPESCMKFIEGHRHVLEIFGITQISSAKVDWMHNPNVHVILVTIEENGKAMAGSRIHQADGVTPLPIEDAVGFMDTRIHDMVNDRMAAGTGEMCGVWNSWEIAGLGIGSYFLSQVGLAVSSSIGLTTLFGLTAPATYRNAVRGGFRVITEIGINGRFYYPKEDLTATAVLTDELETLPTAVEEVRNHVHSFRKNPRQSFQIPNKTNDGFIDIFIDITLE
ncbi:hypothetical protein [Pedobacter frigoris]|uniref:GNAT family N-acetyltransferase n=1 Tax=Pedobacter frigoris TaxID=2571272 RepID=A0A4U1CNE2_9SPHI|nr:hypothetical protein [Pedobacter frigoris]TKC09014.1 hypothetical protein FA047_02660 [Pedobacter frigoris]